MLRRMQNRRQTTRMARFWPRERILNLKKKRRRTRRMERKNSGQQDASQRLNLAHAVRTLTPKRRMKAKKRRPLDANQEQVQPRAVKRLEENVGFRTAKLLCQSDAKRSVSHLPVFLYVPPTERSQGSITEARGP